MPSRRRAFTLVELLVVVGIVALFAALLLPAMARARASAGDVRCKSNLRQIGVAVRLYLQDNRMRFPDHKTFGGWGFMRRLAGERDPDLPGSKPEKYGWSALLDRGGYLSAERDGEVWVCPRARDLFKSYKNTYLVATYKGETLTRVVEKWHRDLGSMGRNWYVWGNLINDNFSMTALPTGEMPPEFAPFLPPAQWEAPHRYGGKGNVEGPPDEPAPGRDIGCINVLWVDLHVGSARIFSKGSWTFME